MSKEAMKLALEALELHGEQYPHMVKGYCLDAITALREALAEQKSGIKQVIELYDSPDQPAQQEPVGEVSKAGFGDYPVICWRKGYVAKIGDKFYTTPPQRTWVGLMDDEAIQLFNEVCRGQTFDVCRIQEFARAIEAKLRERNT